MIRSVQEEVLALVGKGGSDLLSKVEVVSVLEGLVGRLELLGEIFTLEGDKLASFVAAQFETSLVDGGKNL